CENLPGVGHGPCTRYCRPIAECTRVILGVGHGPVLGDSWCRARTSTGAREIYADARVAFSSPLSMRCFE
ncbi:hypothetical protein DPMN_173680, partial [Dreissena polymorpha]